MDKTYLKSPEWIKIVKELGESEEELKIINYNR